jgi:hypothetical protein
MLEAKLYLKIIRFRQTKFDAIFKELKWFTETAFLDLKCYNLLKNLTTEGFINVGSTHVAVQSLCDGLMSIVERLRENRFYDIALNKLDEVK